MGRVRGLCGRLGYLQSLTFVTGALAATLVLCTGPAAEARAKPNIVVVMTDDQALREMRALPFTRRLFAARGVRFENAFATYPLCCPSRASFLSGQYTHNHGVWSNFPREGGGIRAFRDRGTLAPTLNAAGYRTGFFGKYLNGYGRNPRYVPAGWDRWFAKGMFYRYYGYSMSADGRTVRFGDDPRDYLTSVLTRRAARFIRVAARRRNPYFAWVSHYAPHSTTHDAPPPAPPNHRGRFAETALYPSAGRTETDLSDKPMAVRDGARPGSLVHRYRAKLRSLLGVDDSVRRVWSAIRASGEARRTYLFFVSDNGYLMGEHGLRGKSWLYDESVRVPLYGLGPRLPNGRVAKQPVMNIDLAPTFYALAQAVPGAPVDGSSLLPVAADPSTATDRPVLLVNGTTRAIRTPRYLYAEHESGERELYDMLADPAQLDSVHDDPALAATREELATALHELEQCVGDGCRQDFTAPVSP